jgi:cytochrome c oxidase subunit 2
VRRGSIVQLVLLGVFFGAIAGVIAYFIPWLPTQASREAGRIDFVYWFVTIICIAIFALVAAVIAYSILKFRVPDDDDTDGPPIHGHTALEIWWTAIPALLVTAIAIASAIVLAHDEHLPKRHLTVEVTAQQFAWSFKYPSANGRVAGELRLPLGEPTLLELHSVDVIHSFWVPQFRQKQDALPGMVTRIIVTPTKLGTYPVQCTELCGLGHALMNSFAIVMKPADFDAWTKSQGKAIGGGGAAAGSAVYTANGCGSCHTLQAAGSTGKIGPDLDKLPAEAKAAGKPLAEFVRESIVKPGAYIAPGYQNQMPATFGQLPKSQLDALVQYLIASSKGSK